MPELPEVEVVKRSLNSKIQNLVISKVKINDKKLRYRIKTKEISNLVGLRIRDIKRRSKFLLFFFDKPFVMLVHLGMTGKFFFINKKKQKYKTSFYYDLKDQKDFKHDRIIFYFKKKQKLIYNDVRKFGFIKLLDLNKYSQNFHLKNLGPEPLDKKYNLQYFKNYIKGRKLPIKNILMNQKFVSGLGNIYVNEILFSSQINPVRRVKTLTDKEISKIIKYTKLILKNSIKFGGSSIKNFSSDDGKKGEFQQQFKVYGRKGEECSNIDCNKNIIKLNMSNRGSFYCPCCQK